jgi:DNA polymerase III epsilon subunit family exonuclease
MTGQFLKSLNEKQLEAVTAPRKPILLIAGPGTGKTRTLIARIIYEIEHYQISPGQILALTFSNKAANEVKSRLLNELKETAGKVHCQTIHAFCLNLLRKYHQTAGLHKYFSVCDENYRLTLLRNLLWGQIRDNSDKKIRGILSSFSNYELKGRPLPPFSARLYDQYSEHLKKHRLIDFDQILSGSLELLENNTDILEQYQFLFQSILVDEFQDTDIVQYKIIKLLAQKNRNIFVVADDDQSIYAWRGANPENIRKYMEDFAIKEPIFLDTNYRSGPQITEMAQRIVQSTDRIEPDKKIIADKAKSDKLQAFFFKNEQKEVRFILKKIRQWQKEGTSLSEMAVIYPQHRFADGISTALMKERVPYQLASGKNLLEQPLVQKILLYLKLIRDPADTLLLEQLVNEELGHHIYKQIQNYQTRNGISFKKALNDYSMRMEINVENRKKVSDFIGNIANLINLKSFYSFLRLIKEILESIKSLRPSVLRQNVKKIADVNFPVEKKFLRKDNHIWVYHSDSKIAFLALKMIKKIKGDQAYLLKEKNIVNMAPSDFAVILSPLNVSSLPCPYITLFNQEFPGLKGSLSQLLRWLQKQSSGNDFLHFENYVVFDLETTGRDPSSCGVVEIAAVKVEKGEIVDEFQSLVNPGMPIEDEAMAVHHITEEMLDGALPVEDVLPKFIEFIGENLIIAHNGYAFDFKIIDRLTIRPGRKRLPNVRYDSLVLARNLYADESNSIDALSERMQIDAGTRHRALDDVIVLHKIFQRMLKDMRSMEQKTQYEELCEQVALGNIIENQLKETVDRIYFQAGIPRLISPESLLKKEYAEEFGIDLMELNDNLNRIYERFNARPLYYNIDDDYYRHIMETADEFNRLPVDDAIAEFLSYISLINPQDQLTDIDAVSLLTFHSAKGLEFEKVILMGLEDENMPSFFAYKTDDNDDRPVAKKIEEQKRLLYVGITRAKEEVIFTVVKNRFGRLQKSSPFIDEIKDGIDINDIA